MPPSYAKETTVSVSKSRGEIDSLLRKWNCDGIRWTDLFSKGLVRVEFIWSREDVEYTARVSIKLPSDTDIKKLSRHGGAGKFLASKFQRLCAARGRAEHRALLLWLKASFVAVESGIVDAETLFLPFLVARDGQTIAEIAIPRLPDLLTGGGETLLGLPSQASGGR